MSGFTLDDAAQGYLDGRDPDCPAPSSNRSAIYRHCFEVGRREFTGRHWTADEARWRASVAEAKDAGRYHDGNERWSTLN